MSSKSSSSKKKTKEDDNKPTKKNGKEEQEESKKKQQQNEQKPKREIITDPDGSTNIARGFSNEDAKKRRLELMEKVDIVQEEEEDKDVIEEEDDDNPKKKKKKKSLKKQQAQYRNQDLSPDVNKILTKHNKKKLKFNSKHNRQTMQKKQTQLLESSMDRIDASMILNTAQSGYLEPENDMERTSSVSQTQLKRMLQSSGDTKTSRHIYDITLEQTAPYGMKYDRSGRYAMLYGCQNSNSSSHLALLDCHNTTLQHEFYLHNDSVRDCVFLQNHKLIAVAQKTHVYIYDDMGTEIHHCHHHHTPLAIDYLPYHFLLASVSNAGFLKYQDISTGEMISKHRTKIGACRVMRQNPSNSILHLGHANGTVTLWSPASNDYLVKLLCHKGSPITSMAIGSTSGSGDGHQSLASSVMVTGGSDHQIRIWDLRMYKELFSYYVRRGTGPPTSLDISQTGVLGIGHGCHATFWSSQALKVKEKEPYMHHFMPGCGPVQTVRFRPNEDVCGIGHAKGISSIVIPGSGEPNVDTLEYNQHSNPYHQSGATGGTAKSTREAEVKALMDKLSPNTIALNPQKVITGLEDVDSRFTNYDSDTAKEEKRQIKKHKKRGQSKIKSQLRRKQQNVLDQNTLKLRQAYEEQEEARKQKERQKEEKGNGDRYFDNDDDEANNKQVPTALKRFVS